MQNNILKSPDIIGSEFVIGIRLQILGQVLL